MNRSDENFDAVIIGGGVAGCFLSKHLVERGLRVCLIEAGDGVNVGTAVQSTLLEDIGGRIRHPTYDLGYSHGFDGVGYGCYAQGRSLGGGSNINGGLWLPPSAKDRQVLGLTDVDPQPPPYLECAEWQDGVSIQAANFLAAMGADWPQADLLPNKPRYSVGTMHAGGRRRPLAGILPQESEQFTCLIGMAVERLGEDRHGAFATLANAKTLRASEKIFVTAGALGSPMLLARSLLHATIPSGIQVRDHLALRVPIRFDPGVVFQGAAVHTRTPTDERLLSGSLVKVCGGFELPTFEGRQGDCQYVTIFGSPVSVRWPKWGAGRILGTGVYTFTLMLSYPQTVGHVNAPEGNPHVEFPLKNGDILAFIEALKALQFLLGNLVEPDGGRSLEDPLSRAKFLARKFDEAYVRRHVGSMHHPVATLLDTNLIDDFGNAKGMKKITVVDSSILNDLPIGTITPVLADLVSKVATTF